MSDISKKSLTEIVRLIKKKKSNLKNLHNLLLKILIMTKN